MGCTITGNGLSTVRSTGKSRNGRQTQSQKLNIKNMTFTIYHNSRCSKSRQTLALLEENSDDIEIVEYLKTPPTTKELDEICKKLDLEPQKLMRKKEAIYKELNLGQRELSRKEALQVMVENPKLIERPIVISGKQAVIGRPPENVLDIV